jgi:hypothetical protein
MKSANEDLEQKLSVGVLKPSDVDLECVSSRTTENKKKKSISSGGGGGRLTGSDSDSGRIGKNKKGYIQMELGLGVFDCVEMDDPDKETKLKERERRLGEVKYKMSDENDDQEDDDEDEEEDDDDDIESDGEEMMEEDDDDDDEDEDMLDEEEEDEQDQDEMEQDDDEEEKKQDSIVIPTQATLPTTSNGPLIQEIPLPSSALTAFSDALERPAKKKTRV